jgi:sugar-specific transcriptional regulator TrmB
MDLDAVEEAGLTRVEAKVYLSVLELGSGLAGAITRHCGIQRRSVYDALERLIEKGLVSFVTTNNRKHFQAADPKRLSEICHERLNRVDHVLPELSLRYTMSKEKQETTFFKGKQALKTVFDDQLASGREVLVIGASSFAYQIVRFYFEKYDRQRVQKNIFVRAIFSERIRRKIPKAQIRYLPGFHSHAAINVYGTKVAIILWTESPFAILINNREIAESYRKHFELLWGIANL